MGCNLLRHTYNHFNTHEAQYHDTIFNPRIDILPYQYVSQIPCAVYAHARACICVCVWIRLCMLYAQVSSSLLEYVKIYHMSGKTFKFGNF